MAWRGGLSGSRIGSLPVPTGVAALCGEFKQAGYRAVVVGGSARDLVAARTPSEAWDLATTASIREILSVRRDARADDASHTDLTLALLTSQGSHVELTPMQDRHDWSRYGARGNRRPVSTLAEDLAGRDFTVNAMAYDPLTGELFDPHGGRGDLERGLVRALGNPAETLRADPVRVLRGVRLRHTLGFEFDPATRQATVELATTIPVQVGIDFRRASAELHRMLALPVRMDCLRTLHAVGFLEVLLPEVNRAVDCPGSCGDARGLWPEMLDALRWLGDDRAGLAWCVLLGAAGQAQVSGGDGSAGVSLEDATADACRSVSSRLLWEDQGGEFPNALPWAPEPPVSDLAVVATEAVRWPQDPESWRREREVHAAGCRRLWDWQEVARAWFAARCV
jgi:tRNA nucleotidyltransferase/poly(A) polymerase